MKRDIRDLKSRNEVNPDIAPQPYVQSPANPQQYAPQYTPPLPVEQQYYGSPQPVPLQYASQPGPQYAPPAQPQYAPQPAQPQYAPQPQPQYAPARRQQSVETTIGRNIIAILAAVLVFLGLVFLGFLAVPYLTDAIKVVAMFAFSLALAGLGLALSLRKKAGTTTSAKNPFTVTLLGCGLGAVFISVLVTHLYFGMLSEVPAYLILLVWTAISMGVAKLVDSLSVSIVAHVGTAISVCAGYIGLADEGLILFLLGYQVAACAVVIIGNTLWSKRTRTIGLYISLALTAVVSIVALMRSPFATDDAIFLAQFILASIFAALLLQATSRQSAAQRLTNVLATTIIWLLQLALPFGLTIYRLIIANTHLAQYSAFMLAAWVTVLVALAATLGGMHYLKISKAGLGTQRTLAVSLIGYSVIALSVAFSVGNVGQLLLDLRLMLLAYQFDPSAPVALDTLPLEHMSGFLLLALFVVLLQKLSKDGIYTVFAISILCLDSICAISSSYGELATFGGAIIGGLASLIYLAAQLAVLFALYRLQRNASQTRMRTLIKIVSALVAELGLLTLLTLVKIPHALFGDGNALALLVVTALFVAAARLNYQHIKVAVPPATPAVPTVPAAPTAPPAMSATQSVPSTQQPTTSDTQAVAPAAPGAPQAPPATLQPTLATFAIYDCSAISRYLHINELVIFIIGGIWLFFRHNPAIIELLIILAFMVLVIAQSVVRIIDRSHTNAAYDLFYAIAVTAVVIGGIGALTTWYSEAYTVSLIVMLIAFASIAAGFWQRIGVLRIYGLVLVCISIFKLLLFDLGELNSMMRVAAFIGSGVICFGISALYNFAVKRLNR